MRPKDCEKVYEIKRFSGQPGDNAVARASYLPHAAVGVLGLGRALKGFEKLSVMFAPQLLLSCA